MDLRASARVPLLAIVFSLALAIRIQGIGRQFWLLGDQIRDWSIALGRFIDLPLVGPATHVGGYTIGPAFYWILWTIRVVVGPWFDYLPHGGGIGQAIVQSAADVLLLVAVWCRTRSLPLAAAAIVFLATAAYDLCLSALVWNPTMGAALIKIATALVLLDWPERSPWRLGVTAAVAWCAVQSYTGAIFAALGVLSALVAAPLLRGDRRAAIRALLVVAGVVLLLQVPLVVHQVTSGFRDRAMGAVTGSLWQILSGSATPQIAKSWAGLAGAVRFIQGTPFETAWLPWLLGASAVAAAIRLRRDLPLLCVTLLPLLLAFAGYALYVGDFLDHYYYLSLMPAAVLTILLPLGTIGGERSRLIAGGILLVAALSIVPARLRTAATLHRMPQYGLLVDGSREIVRRGQPMRAIQTEFTLPLTAESEFLYRILGGRLDRESPWVAIIMNDGHVVYQFTAPQPHIR